MRALLEHERALVGAAIVAVRPVTDALGDPAGLQLHLSDGRVFRVEGDPTIGSRDVYVWDEGDDRIARTGIDGGDIG